MFPPLLREDVHRCINCGFCHQVCPTYKVTRKEFEAPRGRVQIVKYFLEGKLQARDLQKIMADCIGCDACATFCLSGVRIDRIFQNIRCSLGDDVRSRIKKKLLGWVLGDSGRLCAAATLGRLGQKVATALRLSSKVGNIPLPRLPRLNQRSFRKAVGEVVPAEGKRLGRVAYFTGCATDLMYEDVGNSILHILRKLGIEVVIPREQVCCGAPLLLKGGWEQVLPNVAKNLQALDRDDVDAVVVDCGTCGSTLKKVVPELLADLGLDTEQARRVAAKVQDISQVVAENTGRLPLKRSSRREQLVVTYHDSCHLARGMGVTAEPRKILGALDSVSLVEMEGAGECCGGGGAYQFENVDLSGRITRRKLANIANTEAHAVVTGCPGCRMTLAGNLGGSGVSSVLHLAQLVAQRLEQ